MAFGALAHARAYHKRHGNIFVGRRCTEFIDHCAQASIGLTLMSGISLFEFVAMLIKLIARECDQKPGLAFAIIDDTGLADASLFCNSVNAETAYAMTTRNTFDGLHQAFTINTTLAAHGLSFFNTIVRK